MHFLNKIKSLPMPKQNNVELVLKITYCKLSRQCPKDPMAGVTCVPYITHKSLAC